MGESHFSKRRGFWKGSPCLCLGEEMGWSQNRGVPGLGEGVLVKTRGGLWPVAGELLHGRVRTGNCAVRSSVPSLLRRLSCVSRAPGDSQMSCLEKEVWRMVEFVSPYSKWVKLVELRVSERGGVLEKRSGYFLGFRKGMLAYPVYTHFYLSPGSAGKFHFISHQSYCVKYFPPGTYLSGYRDVDLQMLVVLLSLIGFLFLRIETDSCWIEWQSGQCL